VSDLETLAESSTYWGLVERYADAAPDAVVAVDDRGDVATAAELLARAKRLAQAFVARGIGPGDCVSWVLPSTVDTIVLTAALARLGVVQNPIVPIYGEREIAFVTAQAQARLLVTPGVFRGIDFTAIGRRVAADVGFDVVELAELLDAPASTGTALPPPPTDPDAVRWLFYTSGTTSDPKGARHSDRTVIAGGLSMLSVGMGHGWRFGTVAPFAHIGGPAMTALALTGGPILHLISVFNPVTTCDQLRDWGVEAVAGVGAVVTAILERQMASDRPEFPSVRVMLAGGGPKLPALAARLRDRLGCTLVSAYGLTECPNCTVGALTDPPEALALGEGCPRRGVDLKIVDADGRPVPQGTEGEVRVRGRQLFHGYVDAALDADALDADGYFCTGDVGYLAPEGHLVITGRLKEIVIRNGENISVREVEDLLLQHPDLIDATVVGTPDPVTGERVCAVVVPRDGHDLDLASLRRFCEERNLMRQKIPERLEIVSELPRNAMGKAMKPDVRAMLAARAEEGS